MCVCFFLKTYLSQPPDCASYSCSGWSRKRISTTCNSLLTPFAFPDSYSLTFNSILSAELKWRFASACENYSKKKKNRPLPNKMYSGLKNNTRSPIIFFPCFSYMCIQGEGMFNTKGKKRKTYSANVTGMLHGLNLLHLFSEGSTITGSKCEINGQIYTFI